MNTYNEVFVIGERDKNKYFFNYLLETLYGRNDGTNNSKCIQGINCRPFCFKLYMNQEVIRNLSKLAVSSVDS